MNVKKSMQSSGHTWGIEEITFREFQKMAELRRKLQAFEGPDYGQDMPLAEQVLLLMNREKVSNLSASLKRSRARLGTAKS